MIARLKFHIDMEFAAPAEAGTAAPKATVLVEGGGAAATTAAVEQKGGGTGGVEEKDDGTIDTATGAAAGHASNMPSRYEFGMKWKATPWKEVFAGNLDSNHYFLRSGLIRKDLLPKYDPTARFVPETHIVTTRAELRDIVLGASGRAGERGGGSARVDADDEVEQDGASREDSDDGGNGDRSGAGGSGGLGAGAGAGAGVEAERPDLWVLKLTDSSNAYGMVFLRAPKHVAAKGGNREEVAAEATAVDGAEAAEAAEAAWDAAAADALQDGELRVLQRYVEPKLLAPPGGGAGRKFHIRALVLAVGKLDVYLYKTCRVLVATHAFEGADPGNVGFYIYSSTRVYSSKLEYRILHLYEASIGRSV